MTTSNHLRFDGRVAVITGAGKGLGRAHALLLASRGAKVVVNDYGTSLEGAGHSAQPADEVVAEIVALGGTAIASYDGVHTAAGAQAIIQTAIERFGEVDILVCNAGIRIAQPFEDLSDDVWRRTLAVHLDGTMFITRLVWLRMKNRRYGRIIFTTSPGAMYGISGGSAYGAAKGGIFGLMREIVQEIEEGDIRINALMPGAATRMVPPEASIFWDSHPGLGDPAHVAPLVAYLACSACRDNGQVYCAGGGFFARNAMMQSRGVRLGYDQPITPEQISDRWQEINDMSNAETFANALTHGARMFGAS